MDRNITPSPLSVLLVMLFMLLSTVYMFLFLFYFICCSDTLCNCDINDVAPRIDDGYIHDKSTLPISSVHVGDTGT